MQPLETWFVKKHALHRIGLENLFNSVFVCGPYLEMVLFQLSQGCMIHLKRNPIRLCVCLRKLFTPVFLQKPNGHCHGLQNPNEERRAHSQRPKPNTKTPSIEERRAALRACDQLSGLNDCTCIYDSLVTRGISCQGARSRDTAWPHGSA